MNGEDSDGYAFSQASRPTAPDSDGYGFQSASFFPRDMSSSADIFSGDNFIDNIDEGNAATAPNAEDTTFLAALSDPPSSTYAMGLLFPVQEQALDKNTWNMPGAFNTGDSMDLDHLPPFTVALEVYFDANTPTMYDDSANLAYKQTNASDPKYQGLNRGMLDNRTSEGFLREGGDQSATYNFQMGAPSYNSLLNIQQNHLLQFTLSQSDSLDMPAELPQDFSLDFEGLPGSDIQSYSKNTPDQGSAFRPHSYAYTDDYKQFSSVKRDSISHHRLSALGNGDLLPLTTATSHTPSISSLHLTQPSFFSAHQFMRSSFDQPPALLHRASMDVYNRQRLSIDSLNSGVNAPARNPRSLSSYLPFMGDRDRKLPGSPVGGEWPPQSQQLRHLIRSIFKSSEPSNVDEEDPTYVNGMLPEDVEEEDALGEMTDGTPKKAKRPRRGLFNRFKTTKTSDMDTKLDGFNPDIKQDTAADLIKQESHSSLASRESANQNSVQNSMYGSNPNSLHVMNSNLSQVAPGEPDYGALFHGVGKRRNLVGMKNKKTAKSEAVKVESKDGELAPQSERVSLSAGRASQDYHSGDSKLSQSVQLSQASSASGDGSNQEGTPSSFASASKRMLGSRLLKRRASARVTEPQSDVVEIDLKSLDLPPSTEILSEINTKSRTRGRKEDKAADMVDQSKIYVCGYCSRRFKRQEHLKRHFRSLHTTEKPYECPICLKKFSRTDNLNQHLKVHKQEEEAAAAALKGEDAIAMGET